MQPTTEALEAALARLARAQLRRARTTLEHDGATLARAGAERLVDFSSNDYLGLARSPALGAAMAECAARCGAGSGASHLTSGHGPEHARLEEELAAFTGRQRALLFSTGYMANLAVMAALAARSGQLLLDRLCHASLIDGARLAGAPLVRYAHADAADARRRALAGRRPTTLIATDGLFSMDGDVAPLPELVHAARELGAWLVVDDAHGLGVLGPSGRGTLEQFGLSAQDVPVLIGTLGKAFGSFGAFVAGSDALIEFLIQKARPYIYTTALPQPIAAATRAALALSQQDGARRARLAAHVARFRSRAAAAGIPLSASVTPIQPILLGSAERALLAQRRLRAAGFWVVAIRPPTVPEGGARLRVTLSAAHSEEQIDALIAALARALDPEPAA
jgi:8-amino-7-oxononanoate synthase